MYHANVHMYYNKITAVLHELCDIPLVHAAALYEAGIVWLTEVQVVDVAACCPHRTHTQQRAARHRVRLPCGGNGDLLNLLVLRKNC